MTRCTTLDQALLERTKVDKVLQRLIKKGDDQGRGLAQQVLDNAITISKQKKPDDRLSTDQASKDRISKDDITTKLSRALDGSNAGLKKQKTNDAPAASSAISASVESTATASSKSIGAQAKKQSSAKPEPKTIGKANAIAAPASKAKANHISAKPSTFFSSLQSASKKPGTSNAALLNTKLRDGKNMYVNP